MGFGGLFIESLAATRKRLDDFMFKCNYRMRPKDFSRERKMGFKDTVLFMLNMVKKSLQIELNDFFEIILNKDTTIKKQA